jgi:chlorobactene glucosyltransferase
LLFILSFGWLAIVAWLILRAFGQRGLLRPVVPVAAPPAELAPSVALIVPARDEAGNIGRCLRALLDQNYPAKRLRILVVDDHSADATVAIVNATIDGNARPPKHQTKLLHAAALPARWIGKSHACWIAARAVPADTEWLCFLDADVFAEPALLASAVAAAASDDLDLLSLAPWQELKSFAERLMMPCGLYLLSFCQDLREVQSRHGDRVTATGQFMLIRRAIYEAVGGHAAIRTVICEDLALAGLIKRSGGHVELRDGRGLISTRMYTGWRTLWPGIAKNLVDMLGGPRAALSIALAAVVLSWAAWLIPLADAASCMRGSAGACLWLWPALLGSAAAIGFHVTGAVFLAIPFWYGFIFPLGYTVGAVMALDSVRRRLHGRVTWKGRTYP